LFLFTGCSTNLAQLQNTIQKNTVQKKDLIKVNLEENIYNDIIEIESIPTMKEVGSLKYKNTIFKQGRNSYDLISLNKNYIALYKNKKITLINKKNNKTHQIKRYTKRIKIYKNKVFYILGNNVKILDLATGKETNGIGDTYLSYEDIIYPKKLGGNIEQILNFLPYIENNYTKKELGNIVSKLIGETHCKKRYQLTKQYALYDIRTKKENNRITTIVSKECNTKLTSFNILKIADNKYSPVDLMVNKKIHDDITIYNNGEIFSIYAGFLKRDEQSMYILAYANNKILFKLGAINIEKGVKHPRYLPVSVNTKNGLISIYDEYNMIHIEQYRYIYSDDGLEFILNKGIR